jgi:hypothetical protein
VKNMSMDLKSKERLLQETMQQWRIYSSSYDPLIQWLQEGEYICHHGLDEARQLLARHSLQVSVERLDQSLEQHRVSDGHRGERRRRVL